jgi:hypothetical protein
MKKQNKTKKSSIKSYFIISSAHLGMDEDILEVFANYAKYYNAKVYHLGPLVTDQEKRQFIKATNKINNLDSMYTSKLTDKQIEALEARLRNAEKELNLVFSAQKKRIDTLKRYFPNISFITTDQISIADDKEKFIYNGMNLSQHLFLAPIPPSGNLVIGRPIQNKSIPYLKRLGKSWIAAHPVPSVECFPRPGINQAYNFFTVGALKHSTFPLNTKQQSQFSQMPAAVFVLVDENTGEFHPRQIHIDYRKNYKPHPLLLNDKTKYTPMILDDGLVFIGKKVKEVNRSDRATVSTDDHAPYEHPGVLGSLRLLNELFQPETFVNMGDAADFTSVCHHIKNALTQREGLRIAHDLAALKALLDAQTESKYIKKKILIDSNHHEWLTHYVDQNPEIEGILDWRSLSKKLFPDWNLFIRNDLTKENNNMFYFGDFVLRHGDQDGDLSKAERMFENGKYLCGHWHKFQSHRRAISQGCGAKLSPTYLNGRQTDWQSQLSTLTRFEGVTACSPKIILHDKNKKISRFAYRGKIYEAKHYEIEHAHKHKYDRIVSGQK